jgi:hypothetical protein
MYLYHLISIDLQSSHSFNTHTAKLTDSIRPLPRPHLNGLYSYISSLPMIVLDVHLVATSTLGLRLCS